MILVTVGVSNLPFDRRVAAVDGLAAEGETVVAQCGPARAAPGVVLLFRHSTAAGDCHPPH